MAKDPHSPQNNRPRGETLVWLSSAGLALGILMVVGLLSLIFVEGITVFWPKEVVQLTLKEDSAHKIGDSNTLAGTIVKRQQNIRRHVEEWQIFTGNKDAYGNMFKYIDADDVVEMTVPESIVVAERMEYGNSIFYPVAVVTGEDHRVEAGDDAFWSVFEQLLAEARDRRDRINDLERKDIGKINRKVNDLTIQMRHLDRLESEGEEPQTGRKAKIQEQLDSLQQRFKVLAAQARDLREAQHQDTLEYRLATGQVRSQPVGDLVDAYRPNRMDWLDKVGYFFKHLWAFLSERPREANTEGGIFPAIFGTFVMTVLMSAAVMPFGVVAAIYLREYARQGHFVRAVRIAVNNLAGVPSIVYGVFGLGFFVYFVGGTIDQLFFPDRLPTATFGTGGILWASLTLAIMTVPVVVVATEEALAAVPRGAREASLACGASKWQTIQRVVLPASAPGILTGLILAMARGAGEVAPLMIVGVVKLAPSLPIDGVFPYVHLERKFMHLGFHIYDLGFQSPDSEAARPMVFATTFLLILLVVVLNLGAILIRNHLRKKYATGSF
mgnify:CR=1 FL=1